MSTALFQSALMAPASELVPRSFMARYEAVCSAPKPIPYRAPAMSTHNAALVRASVTSETRAMGRAPSSRARAGTRSPM